MGSDVSVKSKELNPLRLRRLGLVGLLVSWSVVTASFPFQANAGAPESWEQLNKELAAIEYKNLDAEEFLRSAFLRELARQGGEPAFVEMCAQRKYPLVQTAGFALLKKNGSTLLCEQAVRILLSSENPALEVFGPMYIILGQEVHAAAIRDALSTVSKGCPDRPRNYSVVIGTIPIAVVKDWYESTKFICPTCEAIVLDRLFGYYLEKKMDPTPQMREGLRKMATIPGAPRFVYAIYGATDDDGIQAAVVDCLHNPELSRSDVMVLARRRAAIFRSLDLDSLGISQERRDMIERAIRSHEDR